tara:strand:+ start:235 stop:492 length:258 start_codon:yes stop_codon:yes gene_type:complete
MKSIDPKTYNLPPRTKLLENNNGSLFILINRKSRVVMKDGHKIVKIAEDIKKINQNKEISLLTSAPVCSKTKKYLLKCSIPVLVL